MLKNLIFVFIAVAILAGMFLLLNNKKSDSFFLIKEEGEVAFKSNATDTYTALAQDEVSLPNGTYIKTGEFSSAHIVLPDNSVISLDEKTELQVNIADKGIEILQFIGKTWNRVETLTNGGSYEIKSGDAVAAVRGTIFHFEVNEDDTIGAKVEEHSVALSENGEETVVEEDESGMISQDGKISKERISEEFKKSRWYLRNKILDQIKRSGLDNIFLKDKIKKEFIREEMVQTRFNIVSPDVESSLLSIVIDTTDSSVCNKIADIPQYVTYSRYGELYSALQNSCEDDKLSIEEIQTLERIYNTIQ